MRIKCIIVMLAIPAVLNCQQLQTHPRGLMTVKEAEAVSVKVKSEPFSSMLKALISSSGELAKKTNMTAYDSSNLARIYSYLYILTRDNRYAENAWKTASSLFRKTEVLNNPVSRGLNRAKLLRDLAEIYDMCFEVWTPEQRLETSEKIIYNIMTTSSNMGYDANYSIESNWMGVRYGAVLFASLVCDDFNAEKREESRLLPFEWDAMKRLGDHMKANINSNGWNTESLSYFSYNWTFVGPALVALNNRIGEKINKYIEPKSLNSLWGYATSSVAIKGINSKVTQPDFSDDDPMSSYYLFPLGHRLFPESQKPFLKFMLNYLSGPDTWPSDAEQLFYNILWTPEALKAENPAIAGWLNYYDPEQGVALFRNRFNDGDDILAGFTATAKRVRGHQGFDNLGFRLIGLGSIWVVGAGRTGQIAGQSTLFPHTDISDSMTGTDSVGKVSEIRFEKDGSGLVTASGSCMGVINHRRSLITDYSRKSGADAVFILSDISDNGKTWRMNSPEFNSLVLLNDGFLLTSPGGAELKATVFSDSKTLIIRSKKVHYGGDTVLQNRGIDYNGTSYQWTNAIDCSTNGNITVVFTLVPKGEKHPDVVLTSERNVKIGNTVYNQFVRNKN